MLFRSGQLELTELGSPESALEQFEAYLERAPRGALAEEARLGAARAHHLVGHPRDVIAATTRYLEHHPGGYAGAEMMRRRADARRALGDCGGAVDDYRRLQTWWPASREYQRAQSGLAACGAAP